MKVYLNDDKSHIDQLPHNITFCGLKAHCDNAFHEGLKA